MGPCQRLHLRFREVASSFAGNGYRSGISPCWRLGRQGPLKNAICYGFSGACLPVAACAFRATEILCVLIHERIPRASIILSLRQNTGKYRIPCNERIISWPTVLSWPAPMPAPTFESAPTVLQNKSLFGNFDRVLSARCHYETF